MFLFVYGSLRRTEVNHVLVHERFSCGCCLCFVRGGFVAGPLICSTAAPPQSSVFLSPHIYPKVQNTVKGELYRLKYCAECLSSKSSPLLQRLDSFEGLFLSPPKYRRVLVYVQLFDLPIRVCAWTYVTSTETGSVLSQSNHFSDYNLCDLLSNGFPSHFQYKSPLLHTPAPPIVFVILDGFGDFGLAQDLKGAVEGLNRVTRSGRSGLMDSVAPGLACGSDTAHLSLLGFAPKRYYRGRGSFEALGAGMEMLAGDIAFKSNFATINDSGIVVSRRADREFSREGPVLSQCLDGLSFSLPDSSHKYTILVQYATEHRCGVIIRGPGLTDKVSGTDPLTDGLPLVKCQPTVSPGHAEYGSAVMTCSVIDTASAIISQVLTAHEINAARAQEEKNAANVVLLRGPALLCADMPTFEQRHGRIAACVAPTCIIKGLCKTVQFHDIYCQGATGGYDSNFTAKAASVVEACKKQDNLFAFLHIKGVDDAGHDQNPLMKVEMILKASVAVDYLWANLPPQSILAITADHSTPLNLGDHSTEPVPFSVCRVRSDASADGTPEFTEEHCELFGSLGRFCGQDLVHILKSL